MSEKSYFLIQALVVLAMVVFEGGLESPPEQGPRLPQAVAVSGLVWQPEFLPPPG
jgi:hypothetical protein